MTELFNINRNDPGTNDFFPLNHCLLADAQQNDETLLKLKQIPMKSKLISDKNFLNKSDDIQRSYLGSTQKKRNHIIEWYHNALLYTGTTRLIKTISPHFRWPSLEKDVKNFVNTCDECQ